jgi:hypothetical protein
MAASFLRLNSRTCLIAFDKLEKGWLNVPSPASVPLLATQTRNCAMPHKGIVINTRIAGNRFGIIGF